jgi:hypothetical protein
MNYAELAVKIVEILSPIFLALISYLVVIATRWLQAKTDDAYLKGVLDLINVAVLESVKELNQTTVANIKKASEDGTITEVEAAAIKQKAIDHVKGYLGLKGLRRARAVLGSDALDQLVRTKIEAVLHDLKIDGESVNDIISFGLED